MVFRLEIENERLGALAIYADGKGRYTREHARDVFMYKDLLADDNQYLHQELLRISGDEIAEKNGGLKKIMDLVQQVAPLAAPVLLLGETGVGKEIIANAIHYSSFRKNGPFIKVNCGAIPETLLDSGAFRP